jgi:hypothetical protein
VSGIGVSADGGEENSAVCHLAQTLQVVEGGVGVCRRFESPEEPGKSWSEKLSLPRRGSEGVQVGEGRSGI